MQYENDRVPESQRVTLPTPPPVVQQKVKPSVGHYIIVNEGAIERRRQHVRR